ncbi:hypothetical protein N9C56_08540 [Paracoccaceae bacterium]|nr:hypothetical protein [Paracoccaceae bacterium]
MKRVPKEFEKLDRRGVVQISLKTDSEAIARTKAADVEAQLQAYWIALSEDRGVAKRYSAMVKLAASRGLKYRQADELVQRGLEEVLDRIDRMTEAEAKDPAVSGAVLGDVKRPPMLLSAMPELFFELERHVVITKSQDQVRRWQNRRKKAFKNLISTIGDLDIMKVERDDALEFKNWWQDRILDEGLTENSTNKDVNRPDFTGDPEVRILGYGKKQMWKQIFT